MNSNALIPSIFVITFITLLVITIIGNREKNNDSYYHRQLDSLKYEVLLLREGLTELGTKLDNVQVDIDTSDCHFLMKLNTISH